jgi:hypothetical protein
VDTDSLCMCSHLQDIKLVQSHNGVGSECVCCIKLCSGYFCEKHYSLSVNVSSASRNVYVV